MAGGVVLPVSRNGVVTHGKIGTYSNHKCRCEACAKAMRDYIREYMRLRRRWARQALARGRTDE